ncbi:YycC family protein [Paenibacillus pinihumi]|uniref:YycC family protein n=1 Tax=Paenibacillus pinihumi TaxID=669462 RepID=UPI0004145BE4|nr:YycC family protein [Paenibacillus pinihumi]
MSKPLQISPDTAIKLSEQLNVPIEHLMHMPRHILLQKLAELAAKEAGGTGTDTDSKKEDPKS